MTAAGMIADVNQSQIPHTLSDLVVPASADHFLRETFGKHFRFYAGEKERFARLLPWAILNRILRQHRLEPPRLRLVQNGKPVSADLFIAYSSTDRRSANRIQRVRVPELTRLLRDGATLILDAVDELYQPLTALTEELERTFHAHVQINAYAGWRTSQGFDCHWDDHDVFILQVAGRKHWKVYGTTREHPLSRDTEPAIDPPETALWDGLLEDGDMLYIPRGWWHEAIPLDEPTLHLTVGIHTATGADLLSWFVDQLRLHFEVRQDVPRFSDIAEQARWMNRLGEIVRQAWRPELFDEYLAYSDAITETRPDVGLPWTAMPGAVPNDAGECSITWKVRRRANVKSRANGTIEFCANSKRYKFAAAAAPILNLLQDRGTCSVDELCRLCAPGLACATVRAFLRELLSEGLISIADVNTRPGYPSP